MFEVVTTIAKLLYTCSSFKVAVTLVTSVAHIVADYTHFNCHKEEILLLLMSCVPNLFDILGLGEIK